MNYFDWLCYLVKGRCRTGVSHIKVLEILYSTPFTPIVPHDDNRESDGIDLRNLYTWETGQIPDISGPCTMLEMMTALSERLSFLVEDERCIDNGGFFFWQILGNLGIDIEDEDWRSKDQKMVLGILEKLNTRSYGYSGRGGMFPLRRVTSDQRKTEIWRQCSSWLIENGYVL